MQYKAHIIHVKVWRVLYVLYTASCLLEYTTASPRSQSHNWKRLTGQQYDWLLTWSRLAVLRSEGPKFEAEGRQRRGILGRGQRAHSPPRISSLSASARHEMRLVASNVVSLWEINVCWTTSTIFKLLKNVATHLGDAPAPGASSAYTTAETTVTLFLNDLL